jgi:predicted nucleic acid-binding protein
VSVVVDASVASKWFFPEVGSREAEALLVSAPGLAAPDLIVAEVVNVAWKRAHRGEITPEQAAAAAEGIGSMVDELVPMAALAARSRDRESARSAGGRLLLRGARRAAGEPRRDR